MSLRLACPSFLYCLVAICGLRGLAGLAQSSSDFDHALVEFRSGNYSSAADIFARIETASPGQTEAQLYEAKALVHLEKFPQADAVLRGYLKSHRDSSDALYMLGFVLNRENHPGDS